MTLTAEEIFRLDFTSDAFKKLTFSMSSSFSYDTPYRDTTSWARLLWCFSFGMVLIFPKSPLRRAAGVVKLLLDGTFFGTGERDGASLNGWTGRSMSGCLSEKLGEI